MKFNNRSVRNPVKDIAVGAIAGVAGAAAMSGLQSLWQILQRTQSSSGGNEQQENQTGKDEPAPTKAAEAVSEKLLHYPLRESQKSMAGSVMHYLFGGFSGAVYRAVSRGMPLAEAGHGVLYGAALWAVADETVVPAIGLSKPAKESPPSTHLYGLASHLVYGLATDTTYRIVRRFL